MRRLAALARRREVSVALVVLALKAVVLAYGVLALQVLNDQGVSGPLAALGAWDRWDTPQYLRIAEHGYSPSSDASVSIAFFPLFPALIALVATLVRDYLLSAFVVSTVASVACGILLDRVVRLDHSPRVAMRAVVFLFIFPTSYFLHIGYTEALFLALVLGSFLAARGGRWDVAGLLGGLACLTRISGPLLIPALLVEAASQWRVDRRVRPAWLWLAVVPLGFVSYLWLNYVVSGDPFRFVAVQSEYWHERASWPWTSLADTWTAISWRGPSQAVLISTQQLLFSALGFAGSAAAAVLRMRPSYVVWMIGNTVAFTSVSFLISVPRFALTLFPLFVVFALLSRDERWRTAITVWSVLFLALFSGEFVRGRWAF